MAMQRFQMMLDEELDAALAQRAAHEGVSKAELLRTYARERLLAGPLAPDDPVLQLCGSEGGADLVEDEYAGRVSEHVDDALYGPATAPRCPR
ncbi:MAG: ribbon-helix-helix domain-containing protein [Actinomycetota bacterium]|jgi:hypothetical protein|nr:ribbon-helix-helix domain-containing protein [Actinomycetota bacterium]